MSTDPITPVEGDAATGLTLRISLTHPERWATALVLIAAIAFNLIALYPEVSIDAPPLNDSVLHLLNVRRVTDAFTQGQNPTDPWLSQVALGYPLFHHYQHLAYLLPGLIVALSKGALSAQSVLNWTSYVLLSLFPLSLYWSGRRWGLDRLPALCASVLGPLLSTKGLYGLDASSYVWGGFGMYTQLWGMWLLPMGLAQGYHMLRTGRGVLLAVVLVTATLLSHLVLGYILIASLALLALVGPWRLPRRGSKEASPGRRIGRLLALGLLMALVTAYFLAPYLADRAVMNRGVWEYPWKYDSFGAKWVLTALVKGQLLDAGRLPSLTLLFAAGLGFCLWRWREERYRALAALALLWLLFYFGRPTWGVLLDLLPMSRDLHFHRLIAGLHLGGIYLMGLGLAWVWDWARSRKGRRWLLIPAALTLLLLAPVYRERAAYYRQNGANMRETATAVAAERAALDELTQAIRALPPGRVYAGLAGRWGKDLRVGAVPLYALLNGADLDMLGYLYHALALNADIQVLFDDGRLAQYELFNVRYVVIPQDWSVPSFYRILGDYGRWRLYGVETSGYFDLVDADITLAGPKEKWYSAASAWLASNMVAAKQHPVVALGPELSQYGRIYPFSEVEQVIAGVAADPGPSRGAILAEMVGSGVYLADVRVDRESYVMLKVGYHPRWRATVDGARAEAVMLMPSYVGVKLAPGEHHVRLAYEPGVGRWALMGMGLLTLLLIALVERRPERARQLLVRLRHLIARLRAGGSSAWVRWGGRTTRSRRAARGASGSRASDRSILSRKTQLGLYLLLLSVYLMTNAGHFFSTDHVAVYMVAQSLVERGEVALPKPINDSVRGPDGRYYAMFGLGQSLVATPLYVVGRWVDRISSPAIRKYLGGANLGDWGGTVPIFFVSLLNQFVAPLIALLVLRFCLRLGFLPRASLIVALVYGFSTANWVYARDSFQHPLETLLLLTSVYVLYAHKGRLLPRHALISGAAFGGAVLMRANVLWALPALAIYLLYLTMAQGTNHLVAQPEINGSLVLRRLHPIWRAVRDLWLRACGRGILRLAVLFCAPVILALLICFYYNYLRFGSYLAFHPLAQAKGFTSSIWVGLYGHLLSVGRSIFLYSPPVVLAFWAARGFYRVHRAEALLFAAIVAFYLLGYSIYGWWSGGWSWGPRFLLATIPLLVIPLAGLPRSRKAAVGLAVAASLGVAVQLLGVLINYSYVHWDWLALKLSPAEAYLFVPGISPIAMHWQALWVGRHIDLWLLQVLRVFGWPTFLLTLLAELLLLGIALGLLGVFARLGSGVTRGLQRWSHRGE